MRLIFISYLYKVFYLKNIAFLYTLNLIKLNIMYFMLTSFKILELKTRKLRRVIYFTFKSLNNIESPYKISYTEISAELI